MFWVALATLIMSMTGAGDDTFLFRKFLERLSQGVTEEVKDPARRAQAQAAIDETMLNFRTHRDQVGKIGKCIEKADRSYQVSRRDYESCLLGLESIWDENVQKLIAAQHRFQDNVTEAERAAIRRRLEQQ